MLLPAFESASLEERLSESFADGRRGVLAGVLSVMGRYREYLCLRGYVLSASMHLPKFVHSG